MSFGIKDSTWINPPEWPVYNGNCAECSKFVACPCGCGWGFCEEDPSDMYNGVGVGQGCEAGFPRDSECCEDVYSAWRDDNLLD